MMYSIILVIRSHWIPRTTVIISQQKCRSHSHCSPSPLPRFLQWNCLLRPGATLATCRCSIDLDNPGKRIWHKKTYVVLMVLWWLFNSYFMASLWLCDGYSTVIWWLFVIMGTIRNDTNHICHGQATWATMGFYGHPSYAIGIPTQIWICMRMEWWPPRPNMGITSQLCLYLIICPMKSL